MASVVKFVLVRNTGVGDYHYICAACATHVQEDTLATL